MKKLLILLILSLLCLLNGCRLDFSLFDHYDFSNNDDWIIEYEEPWSYRDRMIEPVKSGDYSIELTINRDSDISQGIFWIKKAFSFYPGAIADIEISFAVYREDKESIRPAWEEVSFRVKAGNKIKAQPTKVIKSNGWDIYHYQLEAKQGLFAHKIYIGIGVEANKLRAPKEQLVLFVDDINIYITKLR